MNPIHFKNEYNFYREAYSKNETRRKRGYSWGYTPSPILKRYLIKYVLHNQDRQRRALDIGCGDGRHICLLRNFGFNVVGIDFSSEAVRLCRERYRNDKRVAIGQIDITKRNSLSKFGLFDLIVDWSVLDHVRREHIATYQKNIFNAMNIGGIAIFVEFHRSLPGLFIHRDYNAVNGHYSRGFTLKTLRSTLQIIHYLEGKERIVEDNINQYPMIIGIFKKYELE